jgi:hypothetical protein
MEEKAFRVDQKLTEERSWTLKATLNPIWLERRVPQIAERKAENTPLLDRVRKRERGCDRGGVERERERAQ